VRSAKSGAVVEVELVRADVEEVRVTATHCNSMQHTTAAMMTLVHADVKDMFQLSSK